MPHNEFNSSDEKNYRIVKLAYQSSELVGRKKPQSDSFETILRRGFITTPETARKLLFQALRDDQGGQSQ